MWVTFYSLNPYLQSILQNTMQGCWSILWPYYLRSISLVLHIDYNYLARLKQNDICLYSYIVIGAWVNTRLDYIYFWSTSKVFCLDSTTFLMFTIPPFYRKWMCAYIYQWHVEASVSVFDFLLFLYVFLCVYVSV